MRKAVKRMRALNRLILAAALLLSGCEHRRPLHIAFLPDASFSIDRAAVASIESAEQTLQSRLRRGDTLVVIPILNDAETDIAGRELRIELPVHRDLFDYDLTQLRNRTQEDFRQLNRDMLGHPGLRTDLLGTLRAAAQEISSCKSEELVIIVLLTDFIEDAQFDFKTDVRLSSAKRAKEFARQVSQAWPLDLHGTLIFAGYLRSRELQGLTYERREAIQVFWAEYFRKQGARLTVAMDGPGALPQFLSSAAQSR